MPEHEPRGTLNEVLRGLYHRPACPIPSSPASYSKHSASYCTMPLDPEGSVCVSNRIQVRPLFATNSDPSDGAKTGVAEPPIAKQSRSWRAASGKQ